jgi:hypothetical protein
MLEQSVETICQHDAILLSAEKGLLAFRLFLQDMAEQNKQHSKSCRKFLEVEKIRFEEQELKEAKLLERSARVLNKFRKSSVSIPNPFIITGFSPNEDAWSDAFAAIIGPVCYRELKLQPLKEIIKTIAAKGNEDAINIMKILAPSYQGSVSVNCRVHRGDTIPDIVIHGEGFLIYIENKMRRGSETVHSEGLMQTERQAADLAKRCKQEGVITLGILLSPTCVRAKSTKFVSLSGHELADAIRRAFQVCKSDYKGKLLMEAFIDTFQLLY